MLPRRVATLNQLCILRNSPSSLVCQVRLRHERDVEQDGVEVGDVWQHPGVVRDVAVVHRAGAEELGAKLVQVPRELVHQDELALSSATAASVGI